MSQLPEVLIDNRQVCCPYCKNEFAVKRKNGGGASYVADWQQMNRACIEITSMWLSKDNLRDMPRTKEFALELCRRYGLKITPGAFFARISELVGLGILVSDGQRKPQPHNTTHAPQYVIDMKRASELLNKGGRLK